MTTHDEYRDALALHALGSLEKPERHELEAHLEVCPRCLVELAELREAAADLVHLIEPLDPSAGHWQSLMARLPSEGVVERDAHAAVRPAPRLSRALAAVRGLVTSRPFAWTLRLGVAAVLVLLTFSQVNLLQRLDRAYVEIARMREIGEFVTAPGVSMIPLWGTDLARGAHAKLAYEHSSGRYMVFSSRMPAPPLGKHYQLWVISDRVRAAGAFSPDTPDGRLLAQPRGDEPFVLGMSLEPEGASAAADEPTGGMVLICPPVRHPR